MVSTSLRPVVGPLIEKLVTPLELLGIKPNHITAASFLLTLVSAYLFLFVSRIAGTTLLFVSVSLDSLDGSLARKMNQVSRKGEYLDAMTDKFVELIVFFCFGFYSWPLAFLAGITSILISYSKHRADKFNLKVRGGIFERAERMLFVLVGALVSELYNPGLMVWVLGATFLLNVITIIQRMSSVFNSLKK